MRLRGRRVGGSAAKCAIGLVVVSVVTLVAVNSPLFSARTVRVTGSGNLGDAQVLRLAGVSSSTNILKVSASSVADRLEASPWIARADVRREFPSTIEIDVSVREPAAAVRQAGGGYVLLAGDGTILEESSKDKGLPLLVGFARLSSPVGSRPADLAGPASAAGSLGVWLRDRVESIGLDKDGLTIRLRDGTPVAWGSEADATLKAGALQGVLQWAEEGRATLRSIDVSAPHAPAARVAGKALPEPE